MARICFRRHDLSNSSHTKQVFLIQKNIKRKNTKKKLICHALIGRHITKCKCDTGEAFARATTDVEVVAVAEAADVAGRT